jgi:predicted nucleic acid-binding protein
VALKKAKFIADLKKLSRAGLDSSMAIYHLEDIEPYSELTEIAFAAIARGELVGVWSTITVTELLTKPFAAGQMDRVTACEHFIRSFSHTILSATTYAIAKEAARLRGHYHLRTPDALLLATALHEKADGFLTNDSRLRRVTAEGLTILMLDDYL